MKAAVLEDFQKICLKEREQPECGHEEVIVKIEATGICRTDMKCYFMGQRDLELPRILGHEITGTIEEVGKEVKGYKKGDRVQVFPGISCGRCKYCQEGQENLCHGIKIMGFNYDGGFADYLKIPSLGVKSGVLNPIPDNLTFMEASMAEPLACCINIQQGIDLKKGETVLIFGGGRFGILNAKTARAFGAEKIILIDPDDQRLETAMKYEFDHLINPEKENAYERVMQLTKNRGVEVVIPCCPDPQALNSGLEMAAKKGKIGYFSGIIDQEKQGTEAGVNINLIHYKELFVAGGYGCSLNHNKKALELLSSKTLMIEDMITSSIGLEDLEEGIQKVKDKEELSIVVEPHQ